MNALKELIIGKRPTEALVGPPFGLAVYSFAYSQVGLPPVIAGVLGVICAFAPMLVSQVVEATRR